MLFLYLHGSPPSGDYRLLAGSFIPGAFIQDKIQTKATTTSKTKDETKQPQDKGRQDNIITRTRQCKITSRHGKAKTN
jgi:hypothetical protein